MTAITLSNGDAFEFPEPGQQVTPKDLASLLMVLYGTTDELIGVLIDLGLYVPLRSHIGGGNDSYTVEPAPDSDVPPVRLGLEERTGAWVRL